MRTLFVGFVAALTLTACTAGYQTAANDPAGDALAQVRADCEQQELAPEFDVIRSRIPMTQTGIAPAPTMLTSMDFASLTERIEIARLSEIRDRCNGRKLALIAIPPYGVAQPLWQEVVAILQEDNANQHAMMMALADGEVRYGLFVQESWHIDQRREAAMRPFLLEAGVLDQVPVVQVAAVSGPTSIDWGQIIDEAVGSVLNSGVSRGRNGRRIERRPVR